MVLASAKPCKPLEIPSLYTFRTIRNEPEQGLRAPEAWFRSQQNRANGSGPPSVTRSGQFATSQNGRCENLSLGRGFSKTMQTARGFLHLTRSGQFATNLNERLKLGFGQSKTIQTALGLLRFTRSGQFVRNEPERGLRGCSHNVASPPTRSPSSSCETYEQLPELYTKWPVGISIQL